jgi:hypothetical protein
LDSSSIKVVEELVTSPCWPSYAQARCQINQNAAP